MKHVALGDLCAIRSGGTPSRSNPEYYGGAVPWAKISDIEASDGLLTETEESITDDGLAAIRGRIFKPGTLLFAIYGSIGKMAFAGRWLTANQAILGIENLHPTVLSGRYLFRYLESRRNAFLNDGAGIAQKNLSAAYMRELQIPLPSLEEQRRIARILDQADTLRGLRARALDKLTTLGQAVFHEMFGNLRTNDMSWVEDVPLGELAEVVSGITKGRMVKSESLREVPYLAVSNVQDRFLKMDVVKTIAATEDEIDRYRLRRDDILLTEGGDPDKLGRGTLWKEQLRECIHQNHVFRVRVHDERVRPTFLSWQLGSERGKLYFLRSAKQTTGIASINKTQINAFPLVLPPPHLQQQFEERLKALETRLAAYEAARTLTESLFTSLQHRAFRGEL